MIWQRLVLAVFLLSVGVNLWGAVRDPQLWAIPAALAGWYVADLLSGLIHMMMDYRPCPPGKGLDQLFFYPGKRGSPEYQALFREKMQGINAFERISYDFKNHHPRPDALGRRSVWRLIGSTVIAGALPLSLAGNVAVWLWPVPGWIMAGYAALLLGGGFAQYFHGTLHRRENPWVIRALRRAGLLMTPAAHQVHHDTLKRDFATNCGWSNPVVNRLFLALRARGRLADAGLEPRS
ncbi:fatty acid desaturase family protein [Novosphingobium sp. KCTC 2891]|uniref:fatty acid desaturase family protein n=1 Tax=Novosphingobium sp. KCTC 2891 TaxID=2989730 RepID=UPI002221F2BB|nr:fatty acid desaturase family protein [Novosphingobium sp. KCTC 2891]MCW1384424.1 fatty acid desaturase family protein [Novosphingobium sp. KCTC 2891]